MKTKGKLSYKLRELRKRHKTSSGESDEIEVTELRGYFIVTSKDNKFIISQKFLKIVNLTSNYVVIIVK